MLIHIGKNVGIREKDIVGVFDLENSTVKEASRRFLVESEKKNIVTYATENIPKSFVVTSGKDGTHVFLTQLSAKALVGRAENTEQESFNG